MCKTCENSKRKKNSRALNNPGIFPTLCKPTRATRLLLPARYMIDTLMTFLEETNLNSE